MPNKPAPLKLSKTKARIVAVAITAFNEASFRQVTTAILAKRLGMSEGNFWYHYKAKSDLLAAIQQDFTERWAQTRRDRHAHSDPITAYIAFLTEWQALFERYLFMFRDRSEYGAFSADLVAILPAIYDDAKIQLGQIYRDMIQADILTTAPDEVDDLVLNVIIITRFYLDFQHEAHWTACPDPNAGILQHLTLLRPHITHKSLERIRSGVTRRR